MIINDILGLLQVKLSSVSYATHWCTLVYLHLYLN